MHSFKIYQKAYIQWYEHSKFNNISALIKSFMPLLVTSSIPVCRSTGQHTQDKQIQRLQVLLLSIFIVAASSVKSAVYWSVYFYALCISMGVCVEWSLNSAINHLKLYSFLVQYTECIEDWCIIGRQMSDDWACTTTASQDILCWRD